MKINKHNCFSLLYTLAFSVLVSQQVLAQKQKVSCVGNSITYGYNLSNPSTQSYPGQLQVLLGKTGWEVGNFGDSGRTMLKAGGYSYWDSQRYKDALASNPNYVILKLGTDDSKLEKDILRDIYTNAGATTEDYPEGIYVYWRDGFNLAVNYSSDNFTMNIPGTAKILVGESVLKPAGVLVWNE